MQLSIPADAVAWYAAVVGTAGVVLNLHSTMRDRAKLKIKVSPYSYPMGRDGSVSDVAHVSITVANAGRRPLGISAAWFTLYSKPGQKGVIGDSVLCGKRSLPEGERIEYLVRRDAVTLTDLRGIVVEDLTGRQWHKRLKLRPDARDRA